MSRHTTIGVGGCARVLATPATTAQVAKLVRFAGRHGIDYVVVGKGSNLIVRDGGYEGIVIKMSTHLGKVTVNQRSVRAEGGASFAALSRKITKMGRTGMEFGIGIPGTVGGAVRMNAGAFGGEVSRILRRARIVDANGETRVLTPDDLDFGYRRSGLPEGAIVLSATFHCPPGRVDEDTWARAVGRKQTQPIDERTFGSTFVNPPGDYAARMIEACGLKGHRIGGAMVSDKHANFIINIEGEAKADDVESLIRLMRTRVRDQFGVTLRTEVIVIGNRKDQA
jgi:UDP-N-acetylmuramate dehydrogenase